MAAMSVIGIDFGNESCYVAVAKSGGIETIANDYSLRATPSYIAFSAKNRILGVAAKNQQVTNMKNTIYAFKRLLGRQYNDPHIQQELKYLPFTVVAQRDQSIGIKVHYLGEEHIFTPEQCVAMLLTKLKDTSAIALQTQVNDCVISVPSYFTNRERKALLDAAGIAGLNVLRLMNETTATALTYGIYKQDLPNPEEKARNVFFVDCGHSSLQVFACAFHKGKLRMIATAADPNFGGRDIDITLANHFASEFKTKYKIDVHSNARAFIRLLAEVEKLKKQMSANSTMLPLNIECFMDDKDVHAEMKRADMETLCASLFDRVEQTLRLCLEQSKLRPDEIHSVEIVGGSTRIPAIKTLIEKVFNKVPSTTLNQDEAVSRGCALQCAMLSPAVRVREFNITDVQPYAIHLGWDVPMNEEGKGDMEVFPLHHPVPFSRMLTFYRKEPFTLSAYYSGSIPYPDPKIGSWTIKDIKPTAENESQKVKVKVRVNIHGLFSISSAFMLERSKNDQDEGGDEELENEKEQSNDNEQEISSSATEVSPSWSKRLSNWFSSENKDDNEKKDKKKKHTVKSVDLSIESETHGFSQYQMNTFLENECKMIATDRQEKERVDARNALEEYVYELRSKLSSDEDLGSFVTDNDRSNLVNQLDQMENWLYEEGEDCNRQEYHDKLTTLKNQGDPIQYRKNEFEMRNSIIEDFARAVLLAKKALDQIKMKDPKYTHLTEEDVNIVTTAAQEAHKWLEHTRGTLQTSVRHLPPPITCSQIRTEFQNFEQVVNSVLYKPVPKPPQSPKDDKNPADNANQQPPQANHSEQNDQQPPKEASQEQMDCP